MTKTFESHHLVNVAEVCLCKYNIDCEFIEESRKNLISQLFNMCSRFNNLFLWDVVVDA